MLKTREASSKNNTQSKQEKNSKQMRSRKQRGTKVPKTEGGLNIVKCHTFDNTKEVNVFKEFQHAMYYTKHF